jgi:hypothetical protein
MENRISLIIQVDEASLFQTSDLITAAAVQWETSFL